MKRKDNTLPNEQLQRERMLHGWTQRDVAGYIGTDGYTVNRWERGRAIPSPYFRQKLCELFGKSTEELGFLGKSTPINKESILPSIWHLPFRRNPFFTGREDIFLQLHTRFQKNVRSTHYIPQAITGLPGIGKTQIAIEYAYRYASEYRAILWVQADTPAILLANFLSLASVLRIPEKDNHDQANLVTAIKNWLEMHRDWILIFDNIEGINVLNDFLPTLLIGHVLLTTCTQFTGTLGHYINVNRMTSEEGAFFLLKRTKIITLDDPLEQASQSNYDEARTLVQIMDGLPLVLDQAAAYIEETGCTISEYLRRYQDQSRLLLDMRGTHSEHHPMSIATTFSLVIEKLRQKHPAASTVLQFCAFLHPYAIPEELLAAHILACTRDFQAQVSGFSPEEFYTAEVLAYTQNPLIDLSDFLAIDTVMRELRHFSLLYRNPKTKTLSTHRLVQEIVKDKMSEDQQRFWVEQVVRIVSEAFPKVSVSSWQLCQRYLPQALTCATLIERWNILTPESARLLNLAGSYLLERALYYQLHAATMPRQEQHGQESREGTIFPFREIKRLYDHVQQRKDSNVAHILADLTHLSHQQNYYSLVEPLLVKAVSIYEQVIETASSSFAECLVSLANLYVSQRKFEQAESLYLRGLKIFEEIGGPLCINVINCLRDLAWLSVSQRKFEQAETLYERVLFLRENILGPEHLDVARSLEDYAHILKKTKKEAVAKELKGRAKAIRAKNGFPRNRSVSVPDPLFTVVTQQGTLSELGNRSRKEFSTGAATGRNITWERASNTYQVSTNFYKPEQIETNSVAWFQWIEESPSFTFTGCNGKLTAQKETRQRGGSYWTAYRKIKQKLYKKYIGKTADLTIEKLEAIAHALDVG